MRRLALYSLLFTSLLFAQADPTSRSWNQPVKPFRIAGNLYYVGANEITSYLITSPHGHIVIDGGFEETAPQILANIRTLGFDPRDVKILLSSHAHYDHAAGLAALKKATGARFLSSLGDLPAHARGGLDDPQFGNRFPFPPIEADGIVRDNAHVRVGTADLVAHLTPGHTKGCTTWTTRVRDGKRMLDVAIVCSPTVPTGYKLVGNPQYPNAIDDYQTLFRVLHSLHPDIFLASHGNFFDLETKRSARGGKTNPFIDPKGYEEFVKEMEQRFREAAAKQGAVLK